MSRGVVMTVLAFGIFAIGCAREPMKSPTSAAAARGGPKLVAANDKLAPVSDFTVAATSSSSSSGGQVHEQLPTEKIVKAAEPAPTEEVLLGTADLTHGISGNGPLTNDEIKKWLDDPKN